MRFVSILLFVLLAGPAGAVADPGGGLAYRTATLSEDIGHSAVAVSPSGRYVAWREGTGIRLHDAFTGETLDLPGPTIDANARSGEENLVASDTHVAWRRATATTFEQTELYLYEIRTGVLTEVYGRSGVNDRPVLLLPGWLVWEGLVEVEGQIRSHILAFEIRAQELHDLTPGDANAAWLVHDGLRLAWAGDSVQPPGQGTTFTTVWTHDLRTGHSDLLDESLEQHWNVRVAGDTVLWNVGDDPYVLRVAAPRPGCPGGSGLAVLPVLWALGGRTGPRRGRGSRVPWSAKG